MPALLEYFRGKRPDDPRSDKEVLFDYVNDHGSDWLRENYPEDFDKYMHHVRELDPISTTEEFKRGARRGWEGLKGTYYGAKGLAWKGLGADDYAKENLEWALQHQEEAARPDVQGDPDSWAGWMGEATPSLGEAVLTGAVGAGIGAALVPAPDVTDVVAIPGGFLAGLVGKQAVKNEIRNRAIKALGKDATEEAVKAKMKRELGEGWLERTLPTKSIVDDAILKNNISKDVLQAQMRNTMMQGGGLISQTANSLGMNTGEIYADLGNDPDIDPDDAFNIAIVGGAVAALPDTVMPAMVTGKLIKSLTGQKLTKSASKGLYGKISNSAYGKISKNLIGAGATEGVTEGFQEYVGVLSRKVGRGMTLDEAIDAELSYEESKGIWHAVKVGATAGLMAGAGTSVVGAATGQYSTPEDTEEAPPVAPAPAEPAPTGAAPTGAAPIDTYLSDEEKARVEDVLNREMEATVLDKDGKEVSSDPTIRAEVSESITNEGNDDAARTYYFNRRREELDKKARLAASTKIVLPEGTVEASDPEGGPTVNILSGANADLINNLESAFNDGVNEHNSESTKVVLPPLATLTNLGLTPTKAENELKPIKPAPAKGKTWGDQVIETPTGSYTVEGFPEGMSPFEAAKRAAIQAERNKKQVVPATSTEDQNKALVGAINSRMKRLAADQAKADVAVKKAMATLDRKWQKLKKRRADKEIDDAQYEAELDKLEAPSDKVTDNRDRIRQEIEDLKNTKDAIIPNEAFPSNFIAFNSQPADKTTSGNKVSYPAFFTVNDDQLEAGRELKEAMEKARSEEVSTKTEGISDLTDILTGGMRADPDVTPSKPRTIVVVADPSGEAYHMLAVYKHRGEARVTMPEGSSKPKNTKDAIKLSDVLEQEYEVVGSFRTSVAVEAQGKNAMRRKVDPDKWASFSVEMQKRRRSENKGALDLKKSVGPAPTEDDTTDYDTDTGGRVEDEISEAQAVDDGSIVYDEENQYLESKVGDDDTGLSLRKILLGIKRGLYVTHGTDLGNVASIIKNGLNPGSNISTTGEASTGFDVILVYNRSDVEFKEKGYQEGAVVSRKPSGEPVAILVEGEEGFADIEGTLELDEKLNDLSEEIRVRVKKDNPELTGKELDDAVESFKADARVGVPSRRMWGNLWHEQMDKFRDKWNQESIALMHKYNKLDDEWGDALEAGREEATTGKEASTRIATSASQHGLPVFFYTTNEDGKIIGSQTVAPLESRIDDVSPESEVNELEDILLGEQIRAQIFHADTGEVIIHGNVTITRDMLANLHRLRDKLDFEPVPGDRGSRPQDANEVRERVMGVLEDKGAFLPEDQQSTERTHKYIARERDKVLDKGASPEDVAYAMSYNLRRSMTEGAANRLLAFEEAVSNGADFLEELHKLLEGLGYRKVHSVGEEVAFNPLTEEDMVGGMLPGDRAIITETGWEGEAGVVRGKATPEATAPAEESVTGPEEVPADGFIDGVKFHVTLTSNVESIKRDGIKRDMPGHWSSMLAEKYGDGLIFTFDNYIDAEKWASNMDWETSKSFGSGDISIVAFADVAPDSWNEDAASQSREGAGKIGAWLKREQPVSPGVILWSKVYDKEASNSLSDRWEAAYKRKKPETQAQQVLRKANEDELMDSTMTPTNGHPLSPNFIYNPETGTVDAVEVVPDSTEAIEHNLKVIDGSEEGYYPSMMDGLTEAQADEAAKQIRDRIGGTVEGAMDMIEALLQGAANREAGAGAKLTEMEQMFVEIAKYLKAHPALGDVQVRIIKGTRTKDGNLPAARYSPSEGVIEVYLNRNADSRELARRLIHEVIHALTSDISFVFEGGVSNIDLTSKQRDTISKINRIYKKALETWKRDNPNKREPYTLSNLDEFMAAVMSDRKFIEQLARMPGERSDTNLLQDILHYLKNLILDVLGVMKQVEITRDDQWVLARPEARPGFRHDRKPGDTVTLDRTLAGEAIEAILLLGAMDAHLRPPSIAQQIERQSEYSLTEGASENARNYILESKVGSGAPMTRGPSVNDTALARPMVAMWNEVGKVYRAMYDQWVDMGMNRDGLSYGDFVKNVMNQKVPELMIDKVNQGLLKVGKPTVSKDLTLDSITNKENVQRNAYLILSRTLGSMMKKRGRAEQAVAEAAEKFMESNSELQNVKSDYMAATTTSNLAAKSLGNFLTDMKSTLKNTKGKVYNFVKKVSDSLSGTVSISNLDTLVVSVAEKLRGDEALLFDTLSALAKTDIDFKAMKKRDVPETLNKVLRDPEVSSVLDRISTDGNTRIAAAGLLISLGKTNQFIVDLVQIRNMKGDAAFGAKERDAINDAIKLAMSPDADSLARARTAIASVRTHSRAAERILRHLEQKKKDHKDLLKSQKKGADYIEMDSVARKVLTHHMAPLEESQDAEQAALKEASRGNKPLLADAHHGFLYIVPPDEDISSADLLNKKRNEGTDWIQVFHSTPPKDSSNKRMSRKAYVKKLRIDLDRMARWLNKPGRVKDKTYAMIKRSYDHISTEVVVHEYQARRHNFTLRWIGTFLDMAKESGSPAMRQIARRLNKFWAMTKYHEMVEPISREWIIAEAEAKKALGWTTEGSTAHIRAQVHTAALSYFENHQDLLESEGSVEAAIDKALKEIRKSWIAEGNAFGQQMKDDQTWSTIETYIRASGKVSRAMIKVQEEMGIKVLEESGPYNYFRSAIGAELFTVARHMGLPIQSTVKSMRGLWMDAEGNRRKPKDVEEEIAKRYAEDREALASGLSKYTEGDVWTTFIGGLANKDGTGHFFSAEDLEFELNDDGSYTMEVFDEGARASQDISSEAWAEATTESGGDIVLFAEKLYEKSGGDVTNNDAKALYVARVARVLQEQFNRLNSHINAASSPNSINNAYDSSPRVMMDARQTEGFPSEWLEYMTYEEHQVSATIRGWGAQAAFGTDMSGADADIAAAKEEFESQMGAMSSIEERAHEKYGFNPNKEKSKWIEQEANRVALEEYGIKENGHKIMKDAAENIKSIERLRVGLSAFLRNEATRGMLEYNSWMEILGAITGLVVQAVKTAIIDTSSMFIQPIIKYGVRRGTKVAGSNFIALAKQVVGTFMQAFGAQVDIDAGWQTKYSELNLGDPDNLMRARDRLVASWHREIPTGTRFPGVTKVARAIGERWLRSGFIGLGKRGADTRYATFKPHAPFSQLGGWMHAANVINTWKVYHKMITDALAYFDAHPEAVSNPEFEFNHAHLGMDRTSFEYMSGILGEAGMKLDALALEAKRSKDSGAKTDIFTNDNLRRLATVAQTEITKETSPLTRPSWVYTNELGKISNPLVGWSVEKFADVRRMLKTTDDAGRFSYRATLRSFAPYTLVLPISMAYAMIRDEWDEEILRKKANTLKFDTDNLISGGNIVAFWERASKVGTFGIAGDAVNSVINPATGRQFTVENRVFFLSLLTNIAADSYRWYGRGAPMDWQHGARPAIQNLGGAGLLEFMQATDGIFGLAEAERQVTRRLNTENWLRTVGRGINLDVRTPYRGGMPRNRVKPHVRNMAISAMANDQGTFNEAYREAIKEATRWVIEKRNKTIKARGRVESKKTVHEDAVEYVRASFRDQHPIRKVFVALPTDTQYQMLLNEIPEDHRKDVQGALDLYNAYGERIEVKPFHGKEEKKPSTRRSTRTYRPPAAPTYESMRRKIMREALGY